MSTTTGKWSIRFYREGVTLPVETIDAGNSEKKAEMMAYRMAMSSPERRALRCELVNAHPSDREQREYLNDQIFLRWRLDLTTHPPQFVGINPIAVSHA